MPPSYVKKLILLCRLLKYLSAFGIIFLPLSILVYWIFDLSTIQLLPSHWRILLLEMPHIAVENLTVKMKMMGIFIDLIPTSFLVAILLVIKNLSNEYEKFHFFSKKHIRCLRLIAFIFILKIIIYPFYLLLRSFVFSLDRDYVIDLYVHQFFNELLILFSIILFAYITEAAKRLEEEILGTI